MSQSFSVFLNFNGNCGEAVEFYAGVFQTARGKSMTYGDMPATPGFDVPEAFASKIMYADLMIAGTNIMFSDAPWNTEHAPGANVILTIGSSSEDEVRRWFGELQAGGVVINPLGETFFSKLYGMLVDKFGIYWNISLHA